MAFFEKIFDLYFPKKQDKNEAVSTSKPIKKYGVYILLLVGLFIMILNSGMFVSNAPPEKKPDANVSQDEYVKALEGRLEQAISQIQGVGKVEVMITLKNSKEIVVAEDTKTNEQSTNDGTKTNITSDRENKLVIVKDQPLIVKELVPTLEGVMIIAEGAEDAAVKEKISIAAKTLLGVEPHKIAVFELKRGK